MATVQELLKIGEHCGLEGDLLRDFIRDQQAIDRAEREKERAEREKQREEKEKDREAQRQKDERFKSKRARGGIGEVTFIAGNEETRGAS